MPDIKNKDMEIALGALSRAVEDENFARHGVVVNLTDLVEELEDFMRLMGYTNSQMEEVKAMYDDQADEIITLF